MTKWLKGPQALDRPLDKQGWSQAQVMLDAELQRNSVGIARLARLLILRLNFWRLQVLIDECIDRRRGSGSRHRYEVALWREAFYVARFAYLLFALFTFHCCFAVTGPTWYWPALLSILYLVFFDMLLGLTGSAFIWGRLSTDPFRSLLLSLINYGEVTITFAILYLRFDCLNVRSLSPLQALYFSAVTATTVGFGDISVKGSATTAPHKIGLALVVLQLALFVFFALVLVNTFLTRTIQSDD